MGTSIDNQGRSQDAASYYVVKASASILGGMQLEPGQWWIVAGEGTKRFLAVNGYQIAELQIEALSALFLRPSGEHIVAFMAESAAFEGIGQVKARKLWDTFGERLYVLLDTNDAVALESLLTPESAAQVILAWAKYGDSRTLQWLSGHGFDVTLSRKVLLFFGAETAQKLEEDPYRLLSFCATWHQVDALALKHFGIELDDPRRLRGAIEEACYRIFAAGHTTALSSRLMNHLQGVIGSQTDTFQWRSLIMSALSQGLSNGSFVIGLHGVQPLGALILERQVAQSVVDRLLSTDASELMSTDVVDKVLIQYEKAEGIKLNTQQWQAVHLAVNKPFVLITGGAGVGKTTVLKALYDVYDRVGVSVTQMALAGRAAKRMQEATGRPAYTIASFLHKGKQASFNKRCVVILDEASMIDIITMSQLCELLGSTPRLVLVGDPAQLMPVGPGLVLHALARVPKVPLVELTEVKRYGSDIAAAATSIRQGRWPEILSNPQAAIAFIPCPAINMTLEKTVISKVVLHLYRKDPKNTQILCARRHGPDGTNLLNSVCQAELTSQAAPIKVWSEQHNVYAKTGFKLGDHILCTRNIWSRGLQNGSLGIVVKIDEEPLIVTNEESKGTTGLILAWVDWDDGLRRPIDESMLDDLELGYAITVHKAQGSQWPRVIVPLTGNRMLDRTLIYTAVTRAQKQVLLVGDESAVKAAVEGLPRVQSREVALDLLLIDMLRFNDVNVQEECRNHTAGNETYFVNNDLH